MLSGFRFRKSIKILPGVHLNFSKSGVSTSIGRKGATVNLSPHGTTGSVGVPGTGMSYRKKLGSGDGKSYYAFLAVMVVCYIGWLFYTGEIKKYLPANMPPQPTEQAVEKAQSFNDPADEVAPAPHPAKKHKKKHKKKTAE